MKFIELEQGSDAWLSWRKTVITATDAAVLLGHNPWKDTPYKCWQRKLGLLADKTVTDAMERGKRLEPLIRERFIKRSGLNMVPRVVESSQYGFLGASLDGLSDCGNYILEVKTGGGKLHAMAQEGIIPSYYMDQMQEQLLVTGAIQGFYQVGSEDEEKDICIEVFPDPDFANTFIPVAREFWRCVALNEPPELQDGDFEDKSDDEMLSEDLKVYKAIDEALGDLEEKKKALRKKIIDRCAGQSCMCQGTKIMKTSPKGRIDYELVPELEGVDLEKYRKTSATIWKILVA